MNRRLFTLLYLLAWVLLLGACQDADDDADDDSAPPLEDDDADDDDDDDDLPEWLEFQAGALSVRVRTAPFYMELLGPQGQTLLATAEPEGAKNLSPMPFLPLAFQVHDLGEQWYYADSVTGYEQDENGVALLILARDAETLTKTAAIMLEIVVRDENHLELRQSASGVDDVTCHTAAWRLDEDEHFFGLGLQYDSIDSRGKLRNMFLGIGVDATDQIQNHAPIPFYISNRGYGLFVEEVHKGYFDMGANSDAAFGYKFRTPLLKTHVFYGPDPLKIIEDYTALTGRPPLNPDYLFGYLHWRNENNDEDEVYTDLDELRERGFPASAVLVDAPWMTAYSTFRFNECPTCQFRDAAALIDYAHQRGFAFYLWTAEFVNRVSPIEAPGAIQDNSAQFDYARDQGFLIPILGFIWEMPWWHDDGAMVNFLNPEAYNWYQGLVRNVMELGAQGFKMDGGEYAGADCLGLIPLDAFGLGGFGESNTAHYYYKQAYHELFWELSREYNNDNAICTVRCAVWGEQSHINYFWPGDLDSDWDLDLGLPADIVGGLTLGAAGFPYYSSNNGGFSHYRGSADPLLLQRWSQAECFRPVFEGSRDGTQELWHAPFPPQTEQIVRRYAVLHTRLFPYLKAYAAQAAATGRPIMRMLPLLYMDDPRTWFRDYDYLLGEWLLVAPVYVEGDYERDVYLPAGRWVQYWTNAAHDGPVDLIEPAPADAIPVFAKAGAIVPLLDESVQTLWPTDDPQIVDHLDAADLLWIELFPYGASAFELADGTRLELEQDGTAVALTISAAPLARAYSLRVVPATYDQAAPSAVTGPAGALPELSSYAAWDAAERGWFFDATAGNLWVRDACLAGSFAISH